MHASVVYPCTVVYGQPICVYPTVAFKGLCGRQALCENRRIAAANEVLTKLQTLGRAQPLCWAKLNCKVSLALVKSWGASYQNMAVLTAGVWVQAGRQYWAVLAALAGWEQMRVISRLSSRAQLVPAQIEGLAGLLGWICLPQAPAPTAAAASDAARAAAVQVAFGGQAAATAPAAAAAMYLGEVVGPWLQSVLGAVQLQDWLPLHGACCMHTLHRMSRPAIDQLPAEAGARPVPERRARATREQAVTSSPRCWAAWSARWHDPLCARRHRSHAVHPA
jgi:hypothetical protein